MIYLRLLEDAYIIPTAKAGDVVTTEDEDEAKWMVDNKVARRLTKAQTEKHLGIDTIPEDPPPKKTTTKKKDPAKDPPADTGTEGAAE